MLNILLLSASVGILILADPVDSTRILADTVVALGTPNGAVASYPNLEYIIPAFETSSSYLFYRSQDNPLITIDGIPTNGRLFGIPFREYVPIYQPLSFDISLSRVTAYSAGTSIASGLFENNVAFVSQSPIRLQDSTQFFFNSFISAVARDNGTGFSIVNHGGVALTRKKISVRAAVNQGFTDPYVQHTGTKRFGGNAKISMRPLKNLTLTGYMDYSAVSDFNRPDSCELDIASLFAYGRFHYEGEWIDFSANAAKNTSSQDLHRQIIEIHPTTATITTYNQSVNFQSNGTYYDATATIMPFRASSWSGEIAVGWKMWDVKEPNEVSDRTITGTTLTQRANLLFKPELRDEKFLADFKVQRGPISVEYSADMTKLGYSAVSATTTKYDTIYYNHLASIKIEVIQVPRPWMQNLDIQLRGGRISKVGLGGLSHGFNGRVTFINPVPALNLEASVNFTATSRLNGFIRYYIQRSNNYANKQFASSFGSLVYYGPLMEIGEVNRTGLEVGVWYQPVNLANLKWLIRPVYCVNWTTVATTIDSWRNAASSNTTASLWSQLTIGLFELSVEVTHKNGSEITRDEFAPTGQGALIYAPLQSGYISAVDKNGVDTFQSPNPPDQLHNVEFTILNNARLLCHLPPSTHGTRVTIGLGFNRLRTLYTYMGDVAQYRTLQRAQVPSFYNVVSATLGVEF